MRSAITLRSLVIFTVVPRRGETAIGARFAGVEDAAEVTAERVGEAATLGAAAKISSLRIRPPTPVPLIVARFTPDSAANLRTIGVT
ncbi:unannotated protein [freshwater metagenome]|uniref:Unannotated protein n=1 Tax=freshwater metagenome TaxID=449393 RepID=A0A6J7W6B2_9ZZZZ